MKGPRKRVFFYCQSASSRQPLTVRTLMLSLFLLLLLLAVRCSAEQAFFLRSESMTDGRVLVHSFKTDSMSGAYLIGRFDRDLPGLFPVELRIQAHRDIVIRPEAIRLQKSGVAVPALRPKEIWASYRMNSLDDYPFVFRMILERPAFAIAPSPAWIHEQSMLDTASPQQRRIRYESMATRVDHAFTATPIKRFETRVITLLFPLPVPDHKTPYNIVDESKQLPSITFYFERHDTEPLYDAAKAQAVDTFLKERRRLYERDLRDLFDEHEQLHDHETLRSKEKGR